MSSDQNTSSSDLDDDAIPEVSIRKWEVLPYQFEPVVRPEDNTGTGTEHAEQTPGPTDTDSDSSTESEDDHSLRIDNLDWCSCRCSTTRVYLCSTMQTAEECICCREIPILQYIMEKSNCSCITETHGFIVNCLDADVLTVSFYEYSELNGPIGDEEPVHELYRLVAYRRFVRWVWQKLGKGNRRILPSCVVSKIRMTWPSQDNMYKGFQYPAINDS
ncbi:P2X purinoceptor 7-like [Tubulanus polymorphus]|uniref:P2X purinoceptor 7-like n=1 Tax=Tubulanus polymorphus TaxID=672921 RepID=UPI003DA45C8C